MKQQDNRSSEDTLEEQGARVYTRQQKIPGPKKQQGSKQPRMQPRKVRAEKSDTGSDASHFHLVFGHRKGDDDKR